FAFAARNHDERIRSFPFMIFLFTIINPRKERPQDGGGVAFGRTLEIIKRDISANFFRVIRANPVVLPEMNRPKDEVFVIAAVGFGFAPVIGMVSDDFVFGADHRPKLPAMQAIAMAPMKKRVQIIVGNDVAFFGLAKNRKHDKKDLIPEQAILERAVQWKDGSVIFVRVGRSLLEIEWEKSRSVSLGL